MSNSDKSSHPQNSKQTDRTTKVVGNYAIGKSLGEGTFGKVKMGTHLLTGEKVAIKILEKDRIAEAADIQRVTREIKILKMLRHPNIIQLFEIIETPRQLYLIMEYCHGGEMFELIVQRSRLREREACRYYHQIIAGIEYIHKLGIVHRDLKPENILFDHNGHVKLVDFGLSNLYKTGETLKTACGSPCYAAPEMIAGKRYNGLQVDIWSSGIILFACICGYLPFEDTVTANLYKKILSGEYVTPNYISGEAKDLLKCILNTDPERRYTIEMIRNHPWYHIAAVEPVPRGLFIGKDTIPIDRDIVAQLENYNFSIDYAKKCLEINKHNTVTTTYYLLLHRHMRLNGEIQSAPMYGYKIEPLDFKKMVTESYVSTQSTQTDGERSSRKRDHSEPSGNHSYRAENGKSFNAPKIESTGGSSSIDQELNLAKNLVNRVNHQLKKNRGRDVPLQVQTTTKKNSNPSENSDTPVEKPKVFNERSASPWERPKHRENTQSSQENLSKEIDLAPKTKKITTPLLSPKQSRSPASRNVKENYWDRELTKTEEGSPRNTSALTDRSDQLNKLKIPIKFHEQNRISSARDTPSERIRESNLPEAYNVEPATTARKDKLYKPFVAKPVNVDTKEAFSPNRVYIGNPKETPKLAEGMSTGYKRNFRRGEEVEEQKTYDGKMPVLEVMRFDTSDSTDERSRVRYISVPRGGKAAGSRQNGRQNRDSNNRPPMSNLRGRDFGMYRQTFYPNSKNRPKISEGFEFSVEKSRREGSINLSRNDRTVAASPHNESIDITRNGLFQKSVLNSNEQSVHYSVSKDPQNTSYTDRLSARSPKKDNLVMPDLYQHQHTFKPTPKQVLGDITKSVEKSKPYSREVSPLNKMNIFDGASNLLHPPSPQFKNNITEGREQRGFRAYSPNEPIKTERQQPTTRPLIGNSNDPVDSAMNSNNTVQSKELVESRIRTYRSAAKRAGSNTGRYTARESHTSPPQHDAVSYMKETFNNMNSIIDPNSIFQHKFRKYRPSYGNGDP